MRVEKYVKGTYLKMLPGAIVTDNYMNSPWKVISNDGKAVILQNMKGGTKAVQMTVTDETCSMTFVDVTHRYSNM